MLKANVVMYVYCGALCGMTSGSNNQRISPELIKLLDKFHQNDYKLDFEHVDPVRYNKQYVQAFHFVTFKYNRTCTAVNYTIGYKIDVGNSIEIVTQPYKFSSNEYRLFPLRLEVDYCTAISRNILSLAEYGTCSNFTGCPFLKEKIYRICNWKPNPANFPPSIPNGSYMLELQAVYRSIEMWVARAYGTVSRPTVVY